jgi:diaminopimelate epimerase
MHLSKYHGLGNDFLVVLDDGSTDVPIAVSGDLARRLCDRNRGIGADGVILGVLASPGTTASGAGASGAGGDGSADVVMHLYNADGSRAEMSGNGIRCLAQAVARHRGTDTVDLVVSTDAGFRMVAVRPGADASSISASVTMGVVGVGPDLPDDLTDVDVSIVEVRDGEPMMATGDIGNPHWVVVVQDAFTVDLPEQGPRYEDHVSGGINVEFISVTPGTSDAIDLAVWERGAGATEACGTGACVAAFYAHQWGLVGPEVTVHMPGGDALVRLGALASDEITLQGPSVYIADVVWPHG